MFLLGYIWMTRLILLIIDTCEEGNVCMCIDGTYAVHVDRREHSGLHFTMGKGSMMSTSKKLELATVSYAETEVVSTGGRFPKFVWFRNFRMAQLDVAK